MKTVAEVKVSLQVTSAPETRWRDKRRTDASRYLVAGAQDDAGATWELFAFGTHRTVLLSLKVGDRAGIRGTLALRVKDGVPILAINISDCTVLTAAKAAPELRLVSNSVK